MYDNAASTTWTSGTTSGTGYVETLNLSGGSNQMTVSSPGGTAFPPNTPNFCVGYPWGGWYPWGWNPQPYPVAVPYAVPALDLSPRQKLAIEALKLGTKIPKRLRDQALKILTEGLA